MADTPPDEPAENSDGTAKRKRGRPFPKGHSGNPGGRPKTLAEFKQLARNHSVAAVEKLVSVMKTGADPQAVRAAELLLDRAWGKPAQRTEISGPDGDAVKVTYEDVRQKLVAMAARLGKDDSQPDQE